jgi:hypothetical protein
VAAMPPTLAEIEATVVRMERHYGGHPAFPDYLRLRDRFDADLSDPRDRALSKAAALMQIKYASEPDGTSPR